MPLMWVVSVGNWKTLLVGVVFDKVYNMYTYYFQVGGEESCETNGQQLDRLDLLVSDSAEEVAIYWPGALIRLNML